MTADPTTPGEDPARRALVEALLGLRWALPRTDADARAAVAQLELVAGQLRALYDQVTVDPGGDDQPAWTAPVGSLIAQSAFALDWWRPVLEDVDLDWTINHQAHLSADLSGIASAGAQILDQIEPMAPPFPEPEPAAAEPAAPGRGAFADFAEQDVDAGPQSGFEAESEPEYADPDLAAAQYASQGRQYGHAGLQQPEPESGFESDLGPEFDPEFVPGFGPQPAVQAETAAQPQAALEHGADAEADFEPDYGPRAAPQFEVRYQDQAAPQEDREQGQPAPAGPDGRNPGQESYTPPRGQQSRPHGQPPPPTGAPVGGPGAHPAPGVRPTRPHGPSAGPKRPGKPADKRVAAAFGSVGTAEPETDLERSGLDGGVLDNSGRHRRPAYEFESAAPPPWTNDPAPIPPGPVSFTIPRGPDAPAPAVGMAQRRSGYSFPQPVDLDVPDDGYRPPSERPQRRPLARAGMGVQTVVIGGVIAGLCWWAVVAIGSHHHTATTAGGAAPTAAHTAAAGLLPSVPASAGSAGANQGTKGSSPSATPGTGHGSSAPANGAKVSSMQMELLGGSSQAQQVAVILAVHTDSTAPLTVSIDYYGIRDGKRVAEQYATWNLSGKTSYDLGDSIPSSAYCGDEFTVVAKSGATSETKTTQPGC